MKGKKIPETSLDAYFKGDIKILQFMGMFSMNAVMEQKKPKMSYREWLMCIVGLGHISMGLMGDIYNGIDAAKADWVESITVFAAIVCSAFTLFKGYRLWLSRHNLYLLLKAFYSHWNRQVSTNRLTRDAIEMARSARNFRTYYVRGVSITVTSYASAPVLAWSKWYFAGRNETFPYDAFAYPAKYPFTFSSPWTYSLWISGEMMGLYFFNLWWMSADTLFIQFTTHLAIHFNILADEVRNINNDNLLQSKSMMMHVSRRLGYIVQQHIELRRSVVLMEKWFNPLIFVVVLVDGANLCFCLYGLQYNLQSDNWKLVEKCLLLSVTIAIQILVYCVCAQRLNDAVCRVHQAAYECSWTDMNLAEKTLILLFMIQTEREYIYTSYGFVEINMPQVTTIFSAAMRYFTLLRNFT